MPAHKHNIYLSTSNGGGTVSGISNQNRAKNYDGMDTESKTSWQTMAMATAGGGAAHNNMMPYFVCFIWERIA